MGPEFIGIVTLVLLLAMLVLGLWVGFALFAAGIVAIMLAVDASALDVAAATYWSSLNSWSLAALPLYIWMGEIVFRSGMSETLFTAIAPWLRRIPGRVVHANVVGSVVFSTVCGSSAATCVTIGKISVPEMKQRGYDDGISIGSLAGAGTIGLLIPPSIVLIVYGVAVDESIARLFAAGFLPGLLMGGLFMAYIALWAWRNEALMPPLEPRMAYAERFRLIKPLAPLFILITSLIGSIYTGIASPTDAAAVGVLMALAIVAFNRQLTFAVLRDTLMATAITTTMIFVIVSGAAILTIAMAYTGIPGLITQFVVDMDLRQGQLLIMLTIMFVILGMFLEGISIILLTTATIMPAVIAAGFDKIWFGIFLVIVIETAQITPPFGMNLFVLNGLTGRPVGWLAAKAFPFFLCMLLAIAIIYFFPSIVTFIPDLVYN